eukprot:3260929-Amphidinium_carterae.1
MMKNDSTLFGCPQHHLPDTIGFRRSIDCALSAQSVAGSWYGPSECLGGSGKWSYGPPLAGTQCWWHILYHIQRDAYGRPLRLGGQRQRVNAGCNVQRTHANSERPSRRTNAACHRHGALLL